jgi:hypothetical protein
MEIQMNQTFTLDQVMALMAVSNSSKTQEPNTKAFTPHIGKICIIRTYASGVFMAELIAQDGRMVELKNSRRLWSWKAADGISLSAVAVNGVDKTVCRFPVAVPAQTVLDALEIIPASDICVASINETPIAKAQ